MRIIVYSLTLSLSLVGCQQAPPIDLIDSCLTSATNDNSDKATCELDRLTILVALPDTRPSRAELQSLNLDSDAIDGLLFSEERGPRLCTIASTPATADFLKPGWQIDCNQIDIQVLRPMAVTGRSFTFSLKRGNNGRFLLDGLLASP